MSDVLEECLGDEKSELSKLRTIWDSGVKGQSPGSRVMEELESYWRKLAQQGRSLEEVAR